MRKSYISKLKVKLLLLLFIAVVCIDPATGQVEKDTMSYPKIGLVFSGGGIKGLAEIYALKALDSAGLKVDYITGTSVGAIIGGIYAAGYTGNDIENVANTVDYDRLFSDRVPLRSLSMEEKDMNIRYALQIPVIQEGIQLDRSIMQGQGLWEVFTHLLFPVMYIDDFNNLPIAFQCLSANIKSGEKVHLKTGNIVESIRASMAVPVVFSPVVINDTILVDGGIVRNLPVEEVVDMGSDYVIGISLKKGGFWHDEFINPADILDAMIFYNSARDYDEQKKMCDFFYEYELGPYTASSINNAEDIMEIGRNSVDSLYRTFKGIKDSLDAIYGEQKSVDKQVFRANEYKIDRVTVDGLTTYDSESFIQLINMQKGDFYSYDDLYEIVNLVFSTNQYKSLYYNINQIEDNSYEIEFKVVPKAKSYISLGVQYSDFEGVNIIGKYTTYGLTARQSITNIGMSLGKNFRFNMDHIQPLIKNPTVGVVPFVTAENVELKYNDVSDVINGLYDQRTFDFGLRLHNLYSSEWQIGVQWNQRRIKIDPNFYINYAVEGHNTLGTIGAFVKYNTLDKIVYPKSGIKMSIGFSHIYKQRNHLNFSSRADSTFNVDDLNLNFDPYQKLNFTFNSYTPLSKNFNWQTELQAHANINYQQNYVDNYIIGGLQKTFLYQVPFSGLEESSISTASFASIKFKLRYSISHRLNFSSAASYGTYSFLDEDNNIDFTNTLTGYNSSLNYLSKLGPLEFSVVYTPRNNNWSTIIYFGTLF